MFPWYSFLTYAVITAATRSQQHMSMSNAGRLGFRRALPFNLGIWVGFTIVMALCTLFCTALSALIPAIRLPMLVLGAAYMLYLAWGTFRSSGAIQEAHAREGFRSGLLSSSSTPKFTSTASCPWRPTSSPAMADSRPYCCSLPCCWPSSGLYSPWPGRPSGRCSAFCSPGTPGR